jgi:hypothetical protein
MAFGGFSGFGQQSGQTTGGFGSTSTNPTTTGKFIVHLHRTWSLVFRQMHAHFICVSRVRTLTWSTFPQALVPALEVHPPRRTHLVEEALQAALDLEVWRTFLGHNPAQSTSCACLLNVPNHRQTSRQPAPRSHFIERSSCL